MKKEMSVLSGNGRRFWLAHADAQVKSGLSRAEYCRRHELSYHTLTYWQKKSSRTKSQTSGTLVAVPAALFKEAQSQSTPQIRVVLPNSIIIELSNTFTAAALNELLNVVEKR